MKLRAMVKPKALLFAGLFVALFVAVACGSSATSTPRPTTAAAAAQPTTAAAAQPTTAAAAQPTTAPAAQPKAVTAPTTAPVVTQPAVNPGNVVLMLPAWGNERFDNIHTPGGGNNYLKFMHVDGVFGDKTGKLIPGVIDTWRIASDGLSWIYTVREGTKFHDGSDLTIDDAVWTYQHAWSKGCLESCTNIGNPNTASAVKRTEKTGDNELTIFMELIDSGFTFQQMSELGPDVEGIHPKRDVIYDVDLERAFDKNPIMAGQMSLVDHVISEKISLQRFDDYFYQPANGYSEDRRMQFETMDILLVPEEATRAAALQAGSADVAILSLQTRGQVEDGGGRLIFGEQGVYWWVFFPHQYVDPASTPFSDKNIRRAMSYAMDKELMMEKLYGGSEVAVAKGFGAITPNTTGYSPDLDPLPFDPDKARQILADAGYPNGEGFGKVIINTWVSTALPFLPESALVAADFWEKELNLEVEVNVGDETSLKKAWTAGDLQGQILWRDNEARVDAAGITRAVYGTATGSLRFHEDDALSAKVAIGIGDFNPDTRTKSLNDLYKILHDEHLELGIGYVNIPWAVGPRIGTWEPWPLAFFPSAPWTMTLK